MRYGFNRLPILETLDLVMVTGGILDIAQGGQRLFYDRLTAKQVQHLMKVLCNAGKNGCVS